VSLRSPLGRVLGHGPANAGVHHWWVQRLTSLALVPLGIWFVVSLAALPLGDALVLTEWLQRGWNALLLLLFALVAIWHSQLGVQVVIEDYVHAHGLKTLSLIVSTFSHILIAAAVAYAVLKISL
jgi:succinate dehydrogenase / fumarate reductase, membrane anchor subunit